MGKKGEDGETGWMTVGEMEGGEGGSREEVDVSEAEDTGVQPS